MQSLVSQNMRKREGRSLWDSSERGVVLDLTSSGRGLQQTLLLLTYMYSRPNSTLVLDEPDAHLEVLRQRQIYNLLCSVAEENNNQLIVASHSEVLLNEAANRDVVVAFLGKPHRIDDRGNQLIKSLREIGFEQYYQAEIAKWVLYLEGSTDLAILCAFAKRLNHEGALKAFEKPFVKYVGNDVSQVSTHYYGLKEAVPSLGAVAVFDRLQKGLPQTLVEIAHCWEKREIENYLCFPETLDAYALSIGGRDIAGRLTEWSEKEKWSAAMSASIDEIVEANEILSKGSPWSDDFKVSDEFLDPLFKTFFKKIGIMNLMNKRNFHELVPHVPVGLIPQEVVRVLDRIAAVHEQSQAN